MEKEAQQQRPQSKEFKSNNSDLNLEGVMSKSPLANKGSYKRNPSFNVGMINNTFNDDDGGKSTAMSMTSAGGKLPRIGSGKP